MSVKAWEKYQPNASSPSPQYPYGSLRQETALGVGDGTPLDVEWGNDFEAFKQTAFSRSGLVPSGNTDTVTNSEMFNAMQDSSTRTLWKRSMAEAGYNLVAGSFEEGGTVTTATDVLWSKKDNKTYSYSGTLPHTVAEDSAPSDEPGMWTDRSTAPNAFKQSGAGAVIRPAQSKMGERRTFADFGAIGAMSTNDTAAIQTALNTSAPVLATANQGYLVYDTLQYAAENIILGEGFKSAVFFDSLPTNKDGLVISPVADGVAREFIGLSNVYMYHESGGRHAVVVDLEAPNKRLARFICEKSYFFSNGVGNYSFYVSNSTNAADKFFLAYIENNFFNGGLGLDGVGDSINITGNTFTGVNESLLFKQTTEDSPGTTAPSSMMVFERNNCSANKGIYILEARAPKILNNNLECGAGPGAGAEQALVNIKGLTRTIVGAEITGNAILHAPNCPVGVFLGNTNGALVENNLFGIAATGSGIVISADSKNARIGSNTFIPTGTGREVTDFGVGTKGVIKEPTLLNGWSNVSGRETAKFIKGMDGFVSVSGVIGSGLLSANIELFVLPLGFRPTSRCVFSSFGYTSGDVFGSAVIRADPDGTVRLVYISTGPATLLELGLDCISFFAPDVP